MGQGKAICEEYIVNGDFEAGPGLPGWDVFSDGDGSWVLNNGTDPPPGPTGDMVGALPPISGDYDALVIQDGPSFDVLFQQTITLPSNIISATLSWSDRILNYAGFYEDIEEIVEAFVDPEQEFLVMIGDNIVAHEVFSTDPGDEHIQFGPNSRTIDVTDLVQGFEGQEISVAFLVQTQLFFMNVAVDDVSLDIVAIGTVDIVVDIDIKPGTNSINLGSNGKVPVAIFGSADFDVTTIDPYSITLADAGVTLKGKAQTPMTSVEDVDEDGYDDLVVHVDTEGLDLTDGDTIAILGGTAVGGLTIGGADTIRVIP
jgi:hypothetical protein